VAADEEFAFCGNCGEDVALAVSPDSWLADSACTSHIAWDQSIFTHYTPRHQISGFGKSPELGRGTIQLESTVDGKTSILTLKDMVHTPYAHFNLISISHTLKAGIKVLFVSPGVNSVLRSGPVQFFDFQMGQLQLV
jgi:hypothetical protein